MPEYETGRGDKSAPESQRVSYVSCGHTGVRFQGHECDFEPKRNCRYIFIHQYLPELSAAPAASPSDSISSAASDIHLDGDGHSCDGWFQSRPAQVFARLIEFSGEAMTSLPTHVFTPHLGE